jgi:GTP cyclohydrolase I
VSQKRDIPLLRPIEGQLDQSAIEEAVLAILEAIGEDPERDGLKRTPMRMARSFDFLTSGYRMNAEEVVKDALFDVEYDEMVICKDIDYFSLCEHHMLPFFGKVHIAYIPKGKVVGLSKLPRIVEVFARRLQVQERLTVQIAAAVRELLDPAGVAVVIEGVHLCMVMRGVQKLNSRTITSKMVGEFEANPKTREEFMNLLKGA